MTKRTHRLIALAAVIFICLAGFVYVPKTNAQHTEPQTAAARVNAVADSLLEYISNRYTIIRLLSGLPVTEFPDLTLANAKNDAKFVRKLIARLDAIPLRELPHKKWLFAKMLRHDMSRFTHNEQDYWLEFAVTPYSGGFSIQTIHRVFATRKLQTQADLDNYLHLLDEYAERLDQIRHKTLAQADREMLIAKAAIPGVVATFERFQAPVPKILNPPQDRFGDSLSSEQVATFQAGVAKRINEKIVPAYDRILSIFNEDYHNSAPDKVGISQYPGGRDYYRREIKAYTGLTLTPRQIHERGLAAVAKIEKKMREIREELRFEGSQAAFNEMLREDPQFHAETPEELERLYLKYLNRIEPYIADYFSKLPEAAYGVKRASPAAEAGMTWGNYQPPATGESTGYYHYNGSNLENRSLAMAAAMIYHELIPGHHFQVALQREMEDVHPMRAFLSNTAFNEGWAEYAASLAGEMGAYATPYERYGRLLSQAFLASRLVVDTGMNFFGWSLKRARQYLHEHTFGSKKQIATETLRYSTDIPGQALGYWLGYEKMVELHQRAKTVLGEDFDIREFHAVLIGSGAMSLDVLDQHIDWFIKQKKSKVIWKE